MSDYRIPEKTTYFLGAGFSAPAGIPVMRGFVTEAFRLLKRYASSDLCEKFAKIVNTYRPIAASSEVNIDDIQELFCLVSGSRPKNNTASLTLKRVIALTIYLAELEDVCRMAKLKYEKDYDASKILDLIPNELGKKYINTVFIDRVKEQIERDDRQSDLFKGWKNNRTVPTRFLIGTNGCVFNLCNVCIYQAFLSYVIKKNVASAGNNDAIVTPNYDSVLEYADFNLNGVVNSSEKMISLVKLHGSLHNKADLHFLKRTCDVSNNAHIYDRISVIPDKTLIYLNTPAQETQKPPGKNSRNKIDINPPTWDGSETPTGFNFLRRDAIKHLKEAERIVIIGYSMPKTDVHTKYMMTHGLDTPDRPKIEIWDIQPKQKIEGIIEEFFGKTIAKSIRYESTGLNGFVRNHPETKF